MTLMSYVLWIDHKDALWIEKSSPTFPNWPIKCIVVNNNS